ncbi:MAG TPA: hypothetical protein VF306_21680 [Pirellulales bacterium]
MPIHDWTRVDAGIFHHFHVMWAIALADKFNQGSLPHAHYALLERAAVEAHAYPGQHSVAIHHESDSRTLAVLEIVSPKQKSDPRRFRAFCDGAAKLIRAGVHLLIVDLLPPGQLDPFGFHQMIWQSLVEDGNSIAQANRRHSLAAYVGGPMPQAFCEQAQVGARLPEMPLFLSSDTYISVPLEETYTSAFTRVPLFWRKVLDSPPGSS